MSDLPTSNELLPCPFCGGDAEPIRIGSHYQSAQIQCCNCGCLIESAGEGARSWDAWNRRAAAEPADDLYALLVRRGYAQHEAHAIAFGEKLAALSSSQPPCLSLQPHERHALFVGAQQATDPTAVKLLLDLLDRSAPTKSEGL
jgi:hypothetical protein